MKKYSIKSIAALALGLTMGLSACTGDFEDINKNPYGLENKDLAIGNYFNEAQLSIYFNQSNGDWEYQIMQNLNADMYSGYFAAPTPFSGNNNNMLYYMSNGWNNWNFKMYMIHVVKPMTTVLSFTQEDDYIAIAKVLRIAGASKITDTYGPMPYSKAMQGGLSVEYDSQEEIYKSFFADLDDAAKRMTSFIDKNGNVPARLAFDKICGGNHTTWLRFINTMRLRLAMRVVKADPALAKAQAEAAVANKYGVLTDQDKNIEVRDPAIKNPLMIISRNYNDCCINASFVSILDGYADPRLPKMVLPVGWKETDGVPQDILDQDGKPTKSIGKFVGVRCGFVVPGGGQYKMYSIIKMPTGAADVYSSDFPLPIMKRAEAYFLRAEGALRGWKMNGTAEELYKQGIRTSFADYGVADKADAYIADDTRMAADYVDPYNPALNIKAMNNVTVKFGGTDEEKLQKIITQKWIANFPEGQEAWSEFRRTGYPKIFPVAENRSQYPELTAIGIRRLPFTEDEKNNNKIGVESGYKHLGGQANDNIATRLWWDAKKANF